MGMKTDGILDIGELVVQFLVGAVIPNRPMERLEHGAVGDNGPYLAQKKSLTVLSVRGVRNVSRKLLGVLGTRGVREGVT
jgi:hypothetical protein